MRRNVKASLIGLGVAALGMGLALTPWGAALEERVGLAGLFLVRGPLEPPADVAVVTLDRDTSERLDLPAQVREWPRSLYARLIGRLVEAGVSVIVFDLILDRPQEPEEDSAFAEAIADADRVVLFEYLDAVRRPLGDVDSAAPRWLTTERVVQPLPAFAEGASGLAPFPVPKVPSRVSQFWAFQQVAGERPTLPVVALQRHAMPVYRQWRALLQEEVGGRLGALPDDPSEVAGANERRHLMVAVRQAFRADPALDERLAARVRGAGLPSREQRLLSALIGLYGGEDSRYLNFYGPAGHVPTVALHELLRPGAPARSRAVLDLAGRVVFVGQSELNRQVDDAFTTVFSGSDGVDLSGVEIAATAFANLLEGRSLEPAGLWSTLAVLGAFGVAVGVMAGLLPGLVAVLLCLALAAFYCAGAQIAFARADFWLPVAVPLLVQLPFGLFAGLLAQHRDAQRARLEISRGIRYYLPEKVAAGLAGAPFDPAAVNERVYATCLVSDAQGFTGLAESMPPEALKQWLDGYLETVIASVKHRGGLVTDIVGDGTTCVWVAPTPERSCRANACAAALEIEREIAAFNGRHGPRGLPTRIGLHAGWVMVGNVGGGGRFAYTVVGDTVNTASRIEQLNKQLGTYLLGTEAVIADLDVLVRPVGAFRVIGKSEVLRLGEIRGGAREPHEACLLAGFAEALAYFEDARWEDAVRRFEMVLADHPGDGPARFYLDRCRHYLSGAALPPEPTVIHLDRK